MSEIDQLILGLRETVNIYPEVKLSPYCEITLSVLGKQKIPVVAGWTTEYAEHLGKTFFHFESEQK